MYNDRRRDKIIFLYGGKIMIGKIVKKLLGMSMVIATAAGMCATITQAEADFSDYHFNFYGEYGDDYSYTRERNKDDYSSSYVCYTVGDIPIIMTVVGYGQYGIDETIRKQEVKLFPGENSYIYNWVRESGYYKAVLRGESVTDAMYEGHGMWMPDSDQW